MQMTNKLMLCAIAGCLFLSHHPVIAATEAKAPPVYDIELILFTQPESQQDEEWPAETDAPDTLFSKDVLDSSNANATVELLKPDEKKLTASAYALKRKGYQVLVHTAWRQPVNSRAHPDWLMIQRPNLNGMVRMVKGRYLHFYTDLVLQSEYTGQAYPVKLHRRMRSNELHYIDHPLLGVLIQAKRYEPPVEALVEIPANDVETTDL